MDKLKKKKGKYIDFLPDLKALQDGLYKRRKRHLNSKHLQYYNISEVQVPDVVVSTFLVCNDGDDDKILIFASKTARKALKKPGFFIIDGTFKTCPSPFYQLVSMHLNLGSNERTNNVVAVIVGLLPNKNEETYIRLFELIKEHLGVKINL